MIRWIVGTSLRFRFIVVANNAAHHSENALVMPTHEELERRRISREYLAHNFLVGQ